MIWLIGSRWLRNIAFSLIELLFVIVIISSLLAISLPRFRNTLNQLIFDNFCNTLVNRINYLQEKSSLEQRIYRLKIDLDNRVIKTEFQKELQQDFIPWKGLLARKFSIPNGIEVRVGSIGRQVSYGVNEPCIYLQPDSTIYGEDIEISGLGNKLFILINESTGRIKIRKDKE